MFLPAAERALRGAVRPGRLSPVRTRRLFVTAFFPPKGAAATFLFRGGGPRRRSVRFLSASATS